MKWGWRIILTINLLMALNDVGWFFIDPSLYTFEQDTGFSLAEFEGAYPTVAKLSSPQPRNTAILLIGFSLLALTEALTGCRGGLGRPRWARRIFAATLAGVRLSELATGAIFGLLYLALAVVALVDQLLAHGELTS